MRHAALARVCVVRGALAERFEVVVASGGGGALDCCIGNAIVAVVASDDAAPGPEDGDGIVTMSGGNSAVDPEGASEMVSADEFITFNDGSPIPAQIVAINAVSVVAARFLQIHGTTAAAAIAAAAIPAFSFGMPTVGTTIFGVEALLLGARKILRRTSGPVSLVVSTAALTCVAAAPGDVLFQGYVR